MTKTEKAENILQIISSWKFIEFHRGDLETYLFYIEGRKTRKDILKTISDMFDCESDPVQVSSEGFIESHS